MLFLLAACLNARNAPTEPNEPVGVDLEDQAPFQPAPTGGETQIHAASAFDGEALWITWSEVHEGQFQVWAGRYDLAGEPLVGPMRLDDLPYDALDPAIAIHGDRVLVAWQHDNDPAEDNLATVTTVLGLDGAVLAEPTVVPLQRAGGISNFWMPAVATTPDGFVLAVAAGIEGNFRVVTTALSLDAEPVGPLTEPLRDATVTQVEPELAVDDAGRVHLVFDGSDDSWYSFDGGDAVSLGTGQYPAVAADGSISMAGPGGLVVGRVDDLADAGVAGGISAVAAGAGGPFVAWYRNVTGFDNEIKVGRLVGTTLEQRQDLGVADAPPYGFNLTPIAENLVFVAYQTGDSPDFRLYGRFVRLSE